MSPASSVQKIAQKSHCMTLMGVNLDTGLRVVLRLQLLLEAGLARSEQSGRPRQTTCPSQARRSGSGATVHRRPHCPGSLNHLPNQLKSRRSRRLATLTYQKRWAPLDANLDGGKVLVACHCEIVLAHLPSHQLSLEDGHMTCKPSGHCVKLREVSPCQHHGNILNANLQANPLKEPGTARQCLNDEKTLLSFAGSHLLQQHKWHPPATAPTGSVQLQGLLLQVQWHAGVFLHPV